MYEWMKRAKVDEVRVNHPIESILISYVDASISMRRFATCAHANNC